MKLLDSDCLRQGNDPERGLTGFSCADRV